MDITEILAAIKDRVEELKGDVKYNPHFFLGLRQKHTQSQIALFSAQATKISSYVASHNQLELLEEEFEQKRALQKAVADGAVKVAEVDLRKRLAYLDWMDSVREVAKAANLTIEQFEQVNFTRAQIHLEIEKAAGLMLIEVEKELREVDVHLKKYRGEKEIDFEFEMREMQAAIAAADEKMNPELRQVEFYHYRLLKYQRELYFLQTSGEPYHLIQPQILEKQKLIQVVSKSYERLLQGIHGEDLQRGLPPADDTTDSG